MNSLTSEQRQKFNDAFDACGGNQNQVAEKDQSVNSIQELLCSNNKSDFESGLALIESL